MICYKATFYTISDRTARLSASTVVNIHSSFKTRFVVIAMCIFFVLVKKILSLNSTLKSHVKIWNVERNNFEKFSNGMVLLFSQLFSIRIT